MATDARGVANSDPLVVPESADTDLVIVSDDGVRSRVVTALIVEASLGCGVCNEVFDFRWAASGIGDSFKDSGDLAGSAVRLTTGIPTGGAV